MTTANTFEAAAAELSFEEPSHFTRGFACMMELPPEIDFGEKCEPLSWVNASIKFWASLALRHVSADTMQSFMATLPDTLNDLNLWVLAVEMWAGSTVKVEFDDDHNVLTLHWQESGALVKLNVWHSRSAKRLHSRLMWDTGTSESSAMMAAFGLDALLDLATTRDILMDDED
jgi:hypothetical protein